MDKIFICDDDRVVIESLEKLLRLSGFEVKATEKPEEAVALIKAFRPDVVLLDLIMPYVGGFDICEMLNQDEETRDIPIIIISVLADDIDIKRAYKLGVIGYFTKPYNFDNVLREVKKAIEFKKKKPS